MGCGELNHGDIGGVVFLDAQDILGVERDVGDHNIELLTKLQRHLRCSFVYLDRVSNFRSKRLDATLGMHTHKLSSTGGGLPTWVNVQKWLHKTDVGKYSVVMSEVGLFKEAPIDMQERLVFHDYLKPMTGKHMRKIKESIMGKKVKHQGGWS